jgi:hypothetical protein
MVALVVAVLLLGAIDASPAGASDVATWRLTDVVDGVSAWSAEGPDEYWGLARGRVDAPPGVIFGRVSNFEALPTMYPMLDAVRVLERGPATALVYFHYDMPWPISDRSYTAAHRWWTEPTGAIVLDVEDANSEAPPDDGAIHIERLLARLTFAPVGDGAATDVEYLFRADLAGMLPRRVRVATAWKIPLNAVLAMRRSLAARYALR